jgi:Spy/CpxP family protein refolding chaperone
LKIQIKTKILSGNTGRISIQSIGFKQVKTKPTRNINKIIYRSLNHIQPKGSERLNKNKKLMNSLISVQTRGKKSDCKTLIHFTFFMLVLLGSIFPIISNASHRDTTKRGLPKISNLTESQKTKIKELRTNLKKEILPLRNTLTEKRAKLQTLETADKSDLVAIQNTIDEIHTIVAKMQKMKAAQHQEIRKILTAEQRVEFDLTKQNRRKRQGARRSR